MPTALLSFFGVCIAGVSFGSALKIEVDQEKISQPVDNVSPARVDERSKFPIRWIHAPNTADSFINTLIRIPGACPGLQTEAAFEAVMGLDFANYSASCSESILDLSHMKHLYTAVPGKKPEFDAASGTFMMFLREPQQRLLEEVAYARSRYFLYPFVNLQTAMPFYEGTYVRMLTSGAKGVRWSDIEDSKIWEIHLPKGVVNLGKTRSDWKAVEVTPALVEEAKRRLRTGFSFIGITEEWDLSICLFSKMFNVSCHSAQFRHTDSGTLRTETEQSDDSKALSGWHDPWDNELYEIGKEIFESNLEKYNVNPKSCETCWNARQKKKDD